MLDSVEIEVDAEAVVVRGPVPLLCLSSAVVGGGFGTARAIVNLHVPKNFPCDNPGAALAALARRRAIPAPYVGLMTSAWTEKAEIAREAAHGLEALAIVTVGLGNPLAAGLTLPPAAPPSTINTIVIVDAAPEPAALVNAIMTATEAKAMALAAAGVKCADGWPASGTSTDAVVVAATRAGARPRFGGPISTLGWVVARAARSALDAGIRRWLAEHA